MDEKNFFELISTRHSVRSFKDTLIPEDIVKAILDASVRGPSAGNLQSYQIILTYNKSEKQKLVESAHGQHYILEAPLVMIFCADPKRSSTEYGERGKKLFCIQDATIACTYSQIAAHSLGLSSVWIGSFDEKKVCDILNLQDDLKPIVLLPIGFANESTDATPRRPIEEVVHITQNHS